ncbi:VOC family protein [Niabella hibiscisoli]|uniref:VOC family protein n=1 Tax=Niabella hibiscisoli TaxID=1825928 RepID=UPI0021D42424|nr:VOC family protein [Niabella hibiscisoli]
MKIEHTAFWVADLEKVKDFYCTYFDMIASDRYHNPIKNFTSYFLSFKEGVPALK